MSVNIVRDALAERLGLTVKPGGVQGVLDGAPVRITLEMRLSAHAHQNVYHLNADGLTPAAQVPPQLAVTATFPFKPAFDAGLKVGPAGQFATLQAAGRAGFDQRFATRGTEPDRLESLLTPEVKDALDAAYTGDPGVGVTDHGVTVSWMSPPPYPTIDQLEAPIRAGARAWVALLQGSRTIRPQTGLEAVAVAFAGLSLPQGLELRGCPVGVIGEIGGAAVAISAASYAAGGYLGRVRVTLPEVLPGTPRVLREDKFGFVDRLMAALAGRGEITVGDGAFDKRFAVRSLKPDALKEALTKPVRESMLALDKLVAVELSAVEITGSGPCRTDADLLKLCDAGLALARAVGEG